MEEFRVITLEMRLSKELEDRATKYQREIGWLL
jgi:hypothetical protein